MPSSKLITLNTAKVAGQLFKSKEIHYEMAWSKSGYKAKLKFLREKNNFKNNVQKILIQYNRV